jgi:hypothetical protein
MSSKKFKKKKVGKDTYVVSANYDTNKKFEFYDDCPICRAMKKAEEEGRGLSEKELKKAFQEANDQNKLNEFVKNIDFKNKKH